MTGRTHDLAAFAALSYAIATVSPLPEMSFATALTALSANFIGGLAPDIDQPTANLWNRLPAGGVWSRILSPVLGGHRFISHSLLGVILFGFGLKFLLGAMSSVVLVDMNIVWYAFMIGFISHLITDTFTREGVPWLFPIPINFGIPPFRFMRIKTGGMFEKSIIFPGLMILTAYIYYAHYGRFLDILRKIIN